MRTKEQILFAIPVVIGLILLDVFLKNVLKIPVTTLDIFLTFIVPFLLARVISISFKEQKTHQIDTVESSMLNYQQYLKFWSLCVLFIVLGVLAIWIGWETPFELIESVKGHAHGYSLMILGVCMIIFTFIVMVEFHRGQKKN